MDREEMKACLDKALTEKHFYRRTVTETYDAMALIRFMKEVIEDALNSVPGWEDRAKIVASVAELALLEHKGIRKEI